MTVKLRERMSKEEEDDKLPDKDAAKEFYAKYEPKEIVGRSVCFFIPISWDSPSVFLFVLEVYPPLLGGV